MGGGLLRSSKYGENCCFHYFPKSFTLFSLALRGWAVYICICISFLHFTSFLGYIIYRKYFSTVSSQCPKCTGSRSLFQVRMVSWRLIIHFSYNLKPVSLGTNSFHQTNQFLCICLTRRQTDGTNCSALKSSVLFRPRLRVSPPEDLPIHPPLSWLLRFISSERPNSSGLGGRKQTRKLCLGHSLRMKMEILFLWRRVCSTADVCAGQVSLLFVSSVTSVHNYEAISWLRVTQLAWVSGPTPVRPIWRVCVFVKWNTHVVDGSQTEVGSLRLLCERERVLVEPIKCRPHLFAPRLLTIYLWSVAAEQPRGTGWDAVELFSGVSLETFQRVPNTSRP